jgi:hypothetical protein
MCWQNLLHISFLEKLAENFNTFGAQILEAKT